MSESTQETANPVAQPVTYSGGKQAKPAKQPVPLVSIAGHEYAANIGLELLKARDNAQKQADNFMARMTPESLANVLTWLDTTAFHACENRRQLEACTLVHHLLDTLIPAWAAARASDAPDTSYRKLDIHNALQALGQRGSASIKDQPALSLAVRGYLVTFASLRRVHYEAVKQPSKLSAIIERETKQSSRQRETRQVVDSTLAGAQLSLQGAVNG